MGPEERRRRPAQLIVDMSLEFDVLAPVVLGGTTFEGGRGGIGRTRRSTAI
jgi:ribose/xylose/arabinose/galactoside ABC-type transport system permease subunit